MSNEQWLFSRLQWLFSRFAERRQASPLRLANERIVRHGDTGLRPERPEVLHWWRDVMGQRFGTPEWAE